MTHMQHGHRAFHQHEPETNEMTPGIAIIMLCIYVPGMGVFAFATLIGLLLSLMSFNLVGIPIFGALAYWSVRVTYRGTKALAIGLFCMARAQYFSTKEEIRRCPADSRGTRFVRYGNTDRTKPPTSKGPILR